MKVPNPLPYDPRPSKADKAHRELRKKMEKEHSAFDWVPIGALALIGVTLAMDIEKDVKKCEEKKEKEKGKEKEKERGQGSYDDRGNRRRDESTRHGRYGRGSERERSWDRGARSRDRGRDDRRERPRRDDYSLDGRAYERPYDGMGYDYRPRRRSVDDHYRR